MERRGLLVVLGGAGVAALSGCVSDTGDGGDEAANSGGESQDRSGAYDLSSCEYELNDGSVNERLDTGYNDPDQAETVSVAVGYRDDISDEQLEELSEILEEPVAELQDTGSYATGRDSSVHKCEVALLSNREYIEYIVPLPVEER